MVRFKRIVSGKKLYEDRCWNFYLQKSINDRNISKAPNTWLGDLGGCVANSRVTHDGVFMASKTRQSSWWQDFCGILMPRNWNPEEKLSTKTSLSWWRKEAEGGGTGEGVLPAAVRIVCVCLLLPKKSLSMTTHPLHHKINYWRWEENMSENIWLLETTEIWMRIKREYRER